MYGMESACSYIDKVHCQIYPGYKSEMPVLLLRCGGGLMWETTVIFEPSHGTHSYRRIEVRQEDYRILQWYDFNVEMSSYEDLKRAEVNFAKSVYGH
jgi:hypothetical protein